MDLRGRLTGLAIVVALGALAVVILAAPIQGWLSQRGEISDAHSDLTVLEADNDELEARLERISDPVVLEQIARRDLGLVREGEESYTVLPPSTAGLVLPNSWPFNRVAVAIQDIPQ